MPEEATFGLVIYVPIDPLSSLLSTKYPFNIF